MPEDTTNDGAVSIDTVIRGFTDAELALREVSGAVERIRSASEQLDAARTDQAAAREVLAGTSGAVETLGQQVEALTLALTEVNARLSSLEPEHLWQRLDEHSDAIRNANDQLIGQDNRMRRTTRLVWVGLAIGTAALALLGAVVIGIVPLG